VGLTVDTAHLNNQSVAEFSASEFFMALLPAVLGREYGKILLKWIVGMRWCSTYFVSSADELVMRDAIYYNLVSLTPVGPVGLSFNQFLAAQALRGAGIYMSLFIWQHNVLDYICI
jgi:hypothetical protein